MASARARISDALKGVIYFSGTLGLCRTVRGKSSGLILRYHSVGNADGAVPPYIDPSLCVPLHAFERQMRFLHEHYTPVSLDQVVAWIIGGHPIPPRAVAVTFDDGYQDNYSNAFPILKKYRIPATFYVTAGCVDADEVLWTSKLRYYFTATRERSLRLRHPELKILDLSSEGTKNASFAYAISLIKTLGKGRGDEVFREIESRLNVANMAPLKSAMMSWDDVREMSRAGMVIGAHTLTHPSLPGLPPEEANAEIAGSKALIEERIKVPVHHFAYPNGRGVSHFNAEVKEMVRKAGFRSSATSIDGPVRPGDDPFALTRMGVYRRYSRISCLAVDLERTRLAGAGSRT